MRSCRSDRVDVAFPCAGVVVVAAPAGRAAAARAPTATTAIADRRVRTWATCTGDPRKPEHGRSAASASKRCWIAHGLVHGKFGLVGGQLELRRECARKRPRR